MNLKLKNRLSHPTIDSHIGNIEKSKNFTKYTTSTHESIGLIFDMPILSPLEIHSLFL